MTLFQLFQSLSTTFMDSSVQEHLPWTQFNVKLVFFCCTLHSPFYYRQLLPLLFNGCSKNESEDQCWWLLMHFIKIIKIDFIDILTEQLLSDRFTVFLLYCPSPGDIIKYTYQYLVHCDVWTVLPYNIMIQLFLTCTNAQ